MERDSGVDGATDRAGGDARAGVDARPEPDGSVEMDAGSEEDGGLAGPGLTGILKDEDETIRGSTMVLACTAVVCYFGESDADGRFYFPLEPPVDVALKTLENLTERPRRGATLAPVQIVDGSLVDVGSIFTPRLPEGSLIGPASADPQTLSAGDGLEFTLRRADLRPRIGDALIDVAARAIVEPHIPPIPELGSEERIAVYALHPFAAHSSSPIGVRAPSDLPAGTTVKFRTISEIDGRLSDPADGVADGTHVSTAEGAGILELTWLVISR